MKFFITGGMGFIGYWLTKRLVEAGHQVTIYDKCINYLPENRQYEFYLAKRKEVFEEKVTIKEGDITDYDTLAQSLFLADPDIVIHLAGIPLATVSNKMPEEAVKVNINGTVNILQAIKQMGGVSRFIYTSSSFVYGDFVNEPCTESSPTNPLDFYGGTKLCGEILTKVYSKNYWIPYTIIRPSAVYGPTDCNMRVSQIFVENALLGKPMILENGGQSKVDFTYVEDTAEGFYLASLSPKAVNETFNITRGQGRSSKEFSDIVSKYVDNPIQISQPSDVIRPKRGALDITKAKVLLNYQPKYSLEAGIPIYLEYVKNCGVMLEK